MLAALVEQYLPIYRSIFNSKMFTDVTWLAAFRVDSSKIFIVSADTARRISKIGGCFANVIIRIQVRLIG